MSLSELLSPSASQDAALQPLTAALLECVTPADVVAVIVDRGITSMGARAGLVVLLTDEGRELEVVGSRGYAEGTMNGWQRFPVSASLPLPDVVRSNTSLYLESRADWVTRYPGMAGTLEGTTEAAVSIPLSAGHRVFGALHFTFDTARTFNDAERTLLEELARQTSLAMERALLLQKVEAAHHQAEMILESIDEEFYALDSRWRFTYMNRRATQVWNRKSEELLGKVIWDVFPEASGGTIYTAQVRAMRDRCPVSFEAVSTVRNGWVEGTVHPSDDGGISVYLRSIEKRKQAEQARALANSALRQSEERYRSLLDTALEGILFLNTSAQITHANQRMAQMLGYGSPDEIIDQEVYSLYFPGDKPQARERWAARLQGEQGEWEIRLRRKDGEECWVIAHISVERQERTGTILGAFAMFTDITARRRALEAVQAKSDEVTSILESITDAFVTLDNEWCFAYVNKEGERLLRRTYADLVGKNMWEEYPNTIGSLFETEYLRAVREQVPVSFQAYYPEPLDIWFEVRAYPSPNGLSVYFRNVTEERRAKEEREAMLAEQQRLVAELQAAAIRQRRFLREMLFGFSEGRLRLCESRADLPLPLSISPALVPLSAPALRTLRRQVEATADEIKMPPDRMYDVETAVGEASMNAVRHGGGGTAEVHGDPEKGTLQIWVQDSGAGIAEELIHRAIERGWTTGGFGHGFYLMLKTCDRIWLLTGPNGTTVVIEQDREESSPFWLPPMERK